MLTLPIKKKWFDMIKSGEKKEEYREIKPYYQFRLNEKAYTGTHYIRLRNGYSKSSPTLECDCYIEIDYGKPEWGAEPNKLYYVLKILSVKEVKE
jgi:hypothetical protein